MVTRNQGLLPCSYSSRNPSAICCGVFTPFGDWGRPAAARTPPPPSALSPRVPEAFPDPPPTPYRAVPGIGFDRTAPSTCTCRGISAREPTASRGPGGVAPPSLGVTINSRGTPAGVVTSSTLHPVPSSNRIKISPGAAGPYRPKARSSATSPRIVIPVRFAISRRIWFRLESSAFTSIFPRTYATPGSRYERPAGDGSWPHAIPPASSSQPAPDRTPHLQPVRIPLRDSSAHRRKTFPAEAPHPTSPAPTTAAVLD